MQQQEMRRTIPSIQRANDDEFTLDQRSVWAGLVLVSGHAWPVEHARDQVSP